MTEAPEFQQQGPPEWTTWARDSDWTDAGVFRSPADYILHLLRTRGHDPIDAGWPQGG